MCRLFEIFEFIYASNQIIRNGFLMSSHWPLAKERRTSAMTPLTRSTFLVVLRCCGGKPRIRDAPCASCRPVQKALVKRVAQSETCTSGRPTSRNTRDMKLPATVSAVAVFVARPGPPAGRCVRARTHSPMHPPRHAGTGSGNN